MKKTIRIVIDTAMIIMLPILMAYSLISDVMHEYLGIAMFILFVVHHIFNRKWLFSVFKGKYTLQRAFVTLINLLLLIIMFTLPLSGILMSRYAVPFFAISKGTYYFRKIHIFTAYWGLILMSLHMGIHGNMMVNKIRGCSKKIRIIIRLITSAAVIYGGYVFCKRKIVDYLIMKDQFTFFFGENKIIYIFDYIMLIIMTAVIGYYINNFLGSIKTRKEV